MSAQRLARLSLNQRLAAIALILGGVAIFGQPRSDATVTLNTRELATLVEREMDHVTVNELADWIIAGRTDFRLLDVRSKKEYGAYHIPGAENVPLPELPDYDLYRNEKIVVYSGGGMHSAQAWFLLRASGYSGAYILLYGLEEWKDKILFPTLAADPDPAAAARFQRAAQASEFFGGTPRSGGVAAGAKVAVEMPQVELPSHAPVTRARKKRKEGC